MPKHLPGAAQLVVDSWRLFAATWSQTAKITIWFLYVGLAVFAVSALTKINPAAVLLQIPVQLAGIAISIWCGIRLVLALLRLIDEKPAGDLDADAARSWKLFLPMVVVGLLQGLAIFGGLFLLVIPGIYFAVVLGYSQIAFIDQDVRSWNALAASRELVRGRWWPVFWRNLFASLVMGSALFLIVVLFLGVFGLLAGQSSFFALLGAESDDPLLNGAMSLLDSILQAAFLPLILGFQVRMYRLLQKTR
jgi:hypothetical protein